MILGYMDPSGGIFRGLGLEAWVSKVFLADS